MTRNISLAVGEHYHIYSRGVSQSNIFIDESDYLRFIFLMLHQQSNHHIYNPDKNVESFKKYKLFLPHKSTLEKITSGRCVEIINFALMSNHFHFTLKEVKENGISDYMQRVLLAYAKYFNRKYKRTGHLFESRFQSVHISNNSQLLYLSAYIHKNPKEIKEWRGREIQYPWSSFSDYVESNRWGNLILPDIILGQFTNPDDYKKFVDSSNSNEILSNLDDTHIIDD